MSMLSRFATLGGLPGDPYWANVSYLLVGNGTNGTTTNIKDSSSNNLTTNNTNAVISTAQSKYGSGSVYFNGSSSKLQIPQNSLFTFGTGAFTVEFWIYAAGYPTGLGGDAQGYIAFRNLAGGNFGLFIGVLSGATNRLFTSSSGVDITASSTYANGAWIHIAYVRNGTTATLYQDGASVGSATLSANMTSSGAVNIGSGEWPAAPTLMNAYIYDLRITKGVARYTANYTPAPFPPTSAMPTQ